MPNPACERALDHLLHVSHVLGSNDQLVQAGGGNTSVKCDEGRVMLIKASGTPLGRMSAERGWVAVDLAKLRVVFERPELRTCAPGERERGVLEILYGSVIEPAGARPSVETPLHALLDTVVMHSHPVAGNALAYHPEGERILAEILADRADHPALWVPYIDPGSTLAFRMSDIIAEYRGRHGVPPDILLLQNHGLFVCGPDPTQCVIKQQDALERIERHFRAAAASPASSALDKRLTAAVRKALGPDAVARFSTRPELLEAARGRLSELFLTAYSPDQVVYAGPRALLVERNFTASDIEREIQQFRQTQGADPRLILVRGVGLCVVGANAKKADAAEALALATAQSVLLAGGTARHLEPKDISFIVNWEAEHYRAKQ